MKVVLVGHLSPEDLDEMTPGPTVLITGNADEMREAAAFLYRDVRLVSPESQLTQAESPTPPDEWARVGTPVDIGVMGETAVHELRRQLDLRVSLIARIRYEAGWRNPGDSCLHAAAIDDGGEMWCPQCKAVADTSLADRFWLVPPARTP